MNRPVLNVVFNGLTLSPYGMLAANSQCIDMVDGFIDLATPGAPTDEPIVHYAAATIEPAPNPKIYKLGEGAANVNYHPHLNAVSPSHGLDRHVVLCPCKRGIYICVCPQTAQVTFVHVLTCDRS